MNVKTILIAILLQLALLSCNNQNADAENEPGKKEKAEKKAMDDDNEDEESEGTMMATDAQDSPSDLIKALIAAARTGNYDGLSGFCDPKGGGDGDVRRICNLENGSSKDKEEFRQFFGKAKIKGKPRIDGNEAEVDISYSADGEDGNETISFFKMNGKWYLEGF